MESVQVALLDHRFRLLWCSESPEDNPMVGRQLLEFSLDQSFVREKFASVMLNDPVEEFITEWQVYRPPDFEQPTVKTMRTRFVRIDDISTAAVVAIFRELMIPPSLDEQDKEILCLLADDKTLVEIADRMGRSLSTIEYRTKRLKDAFGVKTLPGLTAEAIRRGLVRQSRLQSRRAGISTPRCSSGPS